MSASPSKPKLQAKLKFRDINKVWDLLPEKKKPRAIGLLLLMVIGMLLEMIGVGLILPIMAVIADPDAASQYPIVKSTLQSFGNPSHKTLMIAAMLFLLVIYILKNTYLTFLAWRQSRFVFETQADMAKDLFSRYLYQPYTFHLQRNSADLINNLQVELNLFMNYMLNPGMLLIAESLVILGLLGLLLYFEPIGAITVFLVFFIAGGVYQWLTKRRIISWGKQRQHHEALRMKHAQQGIGAIKDVKVYGKEAFFSTEYAGHTEQSLKMHQRNSFVQNLTRLWLETLLIAGLSLLFIGMVYQGKTVSEVVPILALFGAVSFRLMPSVNRIVSSVNLLRFGTAITDIIYREFETSVADKYQPETKPLVFKQSVFLEEIAYSYPFADRKALSNITINIEKGQMVGFIGESGSGKSTLIDIIMGVLMPDEGQIKVDAQPITIDNLRSWQGMIGYVPQSIYLTDDTLRRNIAFGIKDDEINDASVIRALKAAQLESLIDELPEGIETLLGERGVRLSGGQRQRIGIARALYHDPEILILDEATSALDMETEIDVMNAVSRLHGEKTILIIAHRHSTLQNADQVFSMNQGRLISTSLGSGN
ncbi:MULTISPECIES: ABC transporter ATP-binding protein [unclassified Methylophaga]|uniref:ABC transporter ATP-binding protein n=1 Tax=unclassified Methylophaga TaxID=2629249 RepID=UPI000C96322B|nr:MULTISPECIES: ABC transporter ATP-binding protein [unclassified Methylophaga]MAK67013.1 ATPase [Methylophaga sp.]MAY18050.1 ATPase [Methylophaga sp.]MBN45475.1 ATPase [Methylophaga sp.]HCD06167.1 ATPase [Methylophaga sp.]